MTIAVATRATAMAVGAFGADGRRNLMILALPREQLPASTDVVRRCEWCMPPKHGPTG
jgi:hypothetical protein